MYCTRTQYPVHSAHSNSAFPFISPEEKNPNYPLDAMRVSSYRFKCGHSTQCGLANILCIISYSIAGLESARRDDSSRTSSRRGPLATWYFSCDRVRILYKGASFIVIFRMIKGVYGYCSYCSHYVPIITSSSQTLLCRSPGPPPEAASISFCGSWTGKQYTVYQVNCFIILAY